MILAGVVILLITSRRGVAFAPIAKPINERIGSS